MLWSILLLPFCLAQQQWWDPQTQQYRQGNWVWNQQSQRWEAASSSQQLQQVAPQAQAQAQGAVNQPILSAKEQRLQQIYGVPGKRNANQKLRTCCRNSNEADVECRRRFCDFNALRPDSVIGFMAQCAPKGPTVGLMWDCASSRVDHTACCRGQGVLDQCLPYCETTKGVPTDYLKYIVCLSQFDKIRFCFQDYLEKNPNVDGDS